MSSSLSYNPSSTDPMENSTSVALFETVAANLLAPLFLNLAVAIAIGLPTLGSGIAMFRIAKKSLKVPSATPFAMDEMKRMEQSAYPSVTSTLLPSPAAMNLGVRMLPVIMASALAIYGLIAAVLIAQKAIHLPDQALGELLSVSLRALGASLSVGVACLASGLALRSMSITRQDQIKASVLMAIYGEAIGLYGLIVALILLA